MDILSILSIIGLPTIFSSLCLLIINRHYAKKDKKEDMIEKNKREFDILKKDFDEFKAEQEEDNERIVKKIEETNKLLDSADTMMAVLTEALQAIIRDRIIQLYNHYSKEKKYMPIYARESFNSMYKQYHKLGGNGVIEDLVEKMYALPTEPPADYVDTHSGDF